MLAVVEHDERDPRSKVGGELNGQRVPGLLLQAQDLGQRRRHRSRIDQRRQVDEPDAVGERIEHVGSYLERQAGLADAAGPDQRQQPCCGQQAPGFGGFMLAAYERRQRARKVRRCAGERPQRRKVLPQLRVDELIDGLGGREIAQAQRPQIPQRERGRQTLAHEVGHRARHDDLPAVRRPHDALGTVDRAAEEVGIARLDDARVHATADIERDRLGRRGIGQGQLDRERRLDRVERIVERGKNAIAQHLDHHTASVLDRLAQDRVVPCHRLRHAHRFLLPQAGAPFYVGEQERADGDPRLHGLPLSALATGHTLAGRRRRTRSGARCRRVQGARRGALLRKKKSVGSFSLRGLAVHHFGMSSAM